MPDKISHSCWVCEREYGVQEGGGVVLPFDIGIVCTRCQRFDSLEMTASRRNDQREVNRINGRY